MCPQGMNIPLEPIKIWSQHTVHVGGSRVVFDARIFPGCTLLALQCFSSILMIGSLLTASTLALFLRLCNSASRSEIRLTISKMSSLGEKLDSKFYMNWDGSTPCTVYIRMN